MREGGFRYAAATDENPITCEFDVTVLILVAALRLLCYPFSGGHQCFCSRGFLGIQVGVFGPSRVSPSLHRKVVAKLDVRRCLEGFGPTFDKLRRKSFSPGGF